MTDVSPTDQHDDQPDIASFKKILSSKPDHFFETVFRTVDKDTRDKLARALLAPPVPSNDMIGISPSRWDCPIQNTTLFGRSSSRSLDVRQTEEKTVLLVVPSLSMDAEELQKVEGALFYEERQLFNVLALSDPNVHVIFITAMPLHPSIVNYYLSFLPNGSDQRLSLFSAFDGSNISLTEKILARPRLQAKIQRIIEKVPGAKTKMICFIPTKAEHQLAKLLNISLEASPEEAQFWGSKTGSRQIFRECNIPLPRGVFESIWDDDELTRQVIKLWSEIPEMRRLVVKLNEGFSGEGNALLELGPLHKLLPESVSDEEKFNIVKGNFAQLRFQNKEKENWESFREKIKRLGCIIEEYIEGDNKQSPSLQGLINADGTYQIVSSHEQILGGNDDQVYLGCRFPCYPSYREDLHLYGKRVARSLAEKGACGRFGVDFIAVPKNGEWDLYALEINLRQGGTTHPYETLHYLTKGNYCQDTGVYLSERNEEKYYMASDNVRKPAYKGLLPSDLMTIIGNHSLLFDEETHTGAIFHLMGALSQYGKVGVTCIGNSYEAAEEIYEKVISVLDHETLSHSQ